MMTSPLSETAPLYRLSVGLSCPDGSTVRAEDVEAFVAARLEAFRVRSSVGYWKGTREASLVIEALDTDARGDGFFATLARDLARVFRQEAVLVERPLVAFAFVGASA